jgi:hypothetical protein
VRWARLYARSRGAQFGLSMAIGVTVAVKVLSHAGSSPGIGWGAFLLLLVTSVLSVGLDGQDQQLDRTAAIRWQPRRLTHLLLIGVVGGGVVLALGSAYGSPAIVLRNTVGLVGLVGVATVAFGAQFSWILPFAWCVVALPLPPGDGTGYEIGTWMLQNSDVTAANWTAWLIGTAGIVGYALRGPRRRYALDRG